MLKKEVGAIIVALLLIATLGAGVASAKGVGIGGGYSGSIDDFFTTDLWNGSFWDHVAGTEEVEAVKEARERAEESPFLVSGGKTDRPYGYWEIDPRYGRAFLWPGTAKYWDVTYGFPWP